MTNTPTHQEKLREEYYQWTRERLDIADHVKVEGYPVLVADWWLEKFRNLRSQDLARLKGEVEGMRKDNSHYKELLGMGRAIISEENTEKVFKMNEDTGWNSALSAVVEVIEKMDKNQ